MKIKMMMTGLVVGTVIMMTGCGTEPQAPGPDYEDQNTEEVSYCLDDQECYVYDVDGKDVYTMVINDEKTGEKWGELVFDYTENGTPYAVQLYPTNEGWNGEWGQIWQGIEDDMENLERPIAPDEETALEWEEE